MRAARAKHPMPVARRCGRAGAWLLLALLVGLPVRARAEPGAWLLLSSAVAHEGAGTPIARRAAQQLARALGTGSVRLVSPARARAEFEQRGSTAPLMVSHGDLDALARDTQMALYHVASGLPAKARQDVERALTRADKVLESLNRESLAAQQLLDACLYLVRAQLQSGQRQAAREQALQCRRRVPDIEPDGTMHPPEVIGILAEAEAELRQREPGSLRVESLPSGCAVYVNGRHLGEAPLELPQLGPGEYRLQAECQEGTAGRVHRVTIGSTRVVKRIDTRFDAAVQTSLDLSLRYDSAAAQHGHAYSDAVEVGRVVGAGEVLLLLPVIDAADKPTDVVQVDRIRVLDGHLLGAIRLRVDGAGAIDAKALSAAVRGLRRGEQISYAGAGAAPLAELQVPAQIPAEDATPDKGRAAKTAAAKAAPAARAAGTLPPPPPAGEPAAEPQPPSVAGGATPPRDKGGWSPEPLGIGLGAAGAVATLVGWGLFAHQYALELRYSSQKNAGLSYANTLSELNAFEPVPLAVEAGGAALLTASLPWLLPPAPPHHVPTWGIVAGGAGGALAIAGTVFLVRGAQCDRFDIEGRCSDILATTRFGALLLTGSLPFLGVPVVYLLRGPGQGRDTNVSLQPAPGGRGAQLIWRGNL